MRGNFTSVLRTRSVRKTGGTHLGTAGLHIQLRYYGQNKDKPKHIGAGVQG
jgi:hypothetical protein